MKIIKKAFNYFFVEERNLSLEHRLFLSSILVGLIISIIGSAMVIILSLSLFTIIISLFLSGFLLVIFYFARFKGIINPFITPIVVFAFVGIFSIWLLAGGIKGPNLLPATLILIFALLIVPVKNRPYIFSFFISCVIIVFLLQYFRPDIIIDYPSEISRWTDSFITTLYCSLGIYLIINFIHKQYTNERLRAEKNETYNVITNFITDWVSLTDMDGNFVSANPAISEMTGFSETELLKMSVFSLVSKSHLQLLGLAPENNANTIGRPFLMRIRRKDETEFIAEFVTNTITFNGRDFLLSTGKDITERKQAEKALLESEAVYRTLVEKLPDGVYKSSHDGKFVDANPAMVSILGYASKEELLAIDIKSQLYFEPGDRESLVLEGKLKEISIYQLKKKDGSGVWVEDHGWYSLGEDGEILFHEGILRNITNRRQEELERQVIYEISQGVTTTNNLHELLKLIHHSLGKVLYADNFFVAMFDKDTGLFSFPYYVDQTDSTPEPLALPKSCTAYVFSTGKPLLITPELFEHLSEQNEIELVGSPSPSWIGLPLKTPKGTIGVLVLQNYEKENVYSEHDIQFLDSIGNQIAMAIDRMRSEDELRESAQQFRSVLETVSLIGLMLDTEGRITLCNDFLLEITGWQREEVLNQKWFDMFISPDIGKDILAGIFYKSISEGIIPKHYDNEIITRNGEHRLIAWSNTILHDHRGVVSGVASIGEDITDSKLAQAEIKNQNEELQKINAEKNKFFSIVAHDLRSPFNGFLGLTKMLVEDLPDLSTEQIHKFAVSMQKSATNLYRLLENLLQWAQIQQGSIPFNPEIVYLQLIADESVTAFQELAKNKGIVIATDIADELVAFADRNMLQTVIRNLVSNAVKFTRKGGKVSISAKNNSDKYVELSIKDSGIGMSSEMINNLFRIDFKTSRKGTEGEPSSGLGLLLCKEFVEKQGGNIWVESEVETGSTFYLRLHQVNDLK